MENSISRRNFLGVAAGTATMMTLSSVRALAAKLPLPSSPVVLNIVDAAGNLALTHPAFDNYSSEKSNLVSRLTFNKATAPELPGKIRAQQAAKRLDIDLVIVGLDALSHQADVHLQVIEQRRKPERHSHPIRAVLQ